MNKFKIHIKKESLYLNEGGAVIGDICFSVDDWYFPEKDWDDFVVSLIYWLTHITTELHSCKKSIVEMRFMEGCFKISLTLNSQSQCTMKFIEGEKLAGDQEIIHKSITIPLDVLINEVKKACETLLEMKSSGDLDFKDDYEMLKESYESLCKY